MAAFEKKENGKKCHQNKHIKNRKQLIISYVGRFL